MILIFGNSSFTNVCGAGRDRRSTHLSLLAAWPTAPQYLRFSAPTLMQVTKNLRKLRTYLFVSLLERKHKRLRTSGRLCPCLHVYHIFQNNRLLDVVLLCEVRMFEELLVQFLVRSGSFGRNCCSSRCVDGRGRYEQGRCGQGGALGRRTRRCLRQVVARQCLRKGAELRVGVGCLGCGPFARNGLRSFLAASA